MKKWIYGWGVWLTITVPWVWIAYEFKISNWWTFLVGMIAGFIGSSVYHCFK